MEKFQTGDIVTLKRSKGIKVFYIITDSADFTVENGRVDIEYELMKIYPVSDLHEMTIADEEEVELIASIDEKENEIIIEFVMKERQLKGLFGEPPFMKMLKLRPNTSTNQKKKEVKKVKVEPVEKKKQFDINEILKDSTAEKQVEAYLEKLDTHLQLLHIAMQNNQTQEIDFQKSQLTKIRRVLMELEYFQLETRRKGDTLTLGQGNRKKV